MSKFDAGTLELLRRAADQDTPVYLVGGALRDALLERPLSDLDLATASARKTAMRLAKSLRGKFVTLDEKEAHYRVVVAGRREIDIAGLKGPDIASDLARRDFTVNAMALTLAKDIQADLSQDRILDPRGGLADIARKSLRAETEAPLKEDPLRLLRAFRIAAQLDFTIEAKTLQLIRRNRQLVRRPAGERVQAELLAFLGRPGASRWARLMDECELLTALFEELEPSRKCAAVYYGPGGVLEHSLETVARLDFLLRNLGKVFGSLAAPVEEEPHRAVLVLAALLHDVAKPSTAKQVGGRLRFFGHDALGAKMASDILKRLKFSGANIQTVSTIIANHLRPGNLAAGGAITDKAAYRFFRDLGAQAVDLLFVCWADHASYLPAPVLEKLLEKASEDPETSDLSRLKSDAARKTIHHLQVIRALLARHAEREQRAPEAALIDGHDVMKTLRLKPGPEIGKWLDTVREAQAEGKLQSREDALRYLAKAKK